MKVNSKMKIVLENTDNSLHYRTPASSHDSGDNDAAAKVVMVKPTSVKRYKKKVHPKPAQDGPLHYHRFPN